MDEKSYLDQKNLPFVSEERLKEAVECVVRKFTEREGIFPSSITIVAEGRRRNDSSNLVVSKSVFCISECHEKF